jgi:hypothetical protein
MYILFRCDQEMTHRLKCKSDLASETIIAIDKQKIALLTFMGKSSQALVSPLTKSFHTAFENGVEVLRVHPVTTSALISIADPNKNITETKRNTSHSTETVTQSTSTATWGSWLFGSSSSNNSTSHQFNTSVNQTNTNIDSTPEIIDFSDWEIPSKSPSLQGNNDIIKDGPKMSTNMCKVGRPLHPGHEISADDTQSFTKEEGETQVTDMLMNGGYVSLNKPNQTEEVKIDSLSELVPTRQRVDSYDSDVEEDRLHLAPPITGEVVLYYCGCINSVGVPGTLYITPHYVAMTSSLLGLASRKQLYFLWDLAEVNIVRIGESTATTPSTSGVSKLSTVTAWANSTTVGSLASSYLPMSCTLVFRYKNGGGGKRRGGSYVSEVDETIPGIVNQTTTINPAYYSAIVQRELSFTPAIESCERVKDVLLTARDMLMSVYM